MTDSDGKLIWRGRYSTFGKVSFESITAHTPRGFTQNLRMQGQYEDKEVGLCYNTFRYYDPDIGRFTTEDPIGLLGGINLYQYGPNPLAWIDPFGWCISKVSRNSARNLLKSRGLTKQQQRNTVESFDGQIYASRGKAGDQFVVTESVAGEASGVYVTRGSAGATPAERRANLALPPGNTAAVESPIQLTRDQVLLEGKVAAQPQWGNDKTGGGWQVVTAGGKYTGATER
jgi:RHS repeat-associated protein